MATVGRRMAPRRARTQTRGLLGLFRRGHLGTEADRATFRTLHTASLAAPALREGLTAASAERSSRHLRTARHARRWRSPTPRAAGLGRRRAATTPPGAAVGAERASSPGAPGSSTARDLACDDPGCPVRHAIVEPAGRRRRVVGTLQVVRAARAPPAWSAPPTRSRSGCPASSSWPSSTRPRTRLMEAEVRALRAQISPHFIYNSLGAIASFVRTDPDRARELLLEFADFTRYSFRRHGEFTTLAEELRSIERYLLLEQARFGDRLQVTLRVAPEVLPVAVPFLCIQPLVENAVRHGLEGRRQADGTGRIRSSPATSDQECVIEVEDDGVGEDPETRTARARRRRRRSTRSASATSTRGCATPSATTTVWSWRPRRAPAPR